MKAIYRIYPAIGVARIGNSETEHFLGPESLGVIPPGPCRDAVGKIKPQGVRFRIYQFRRDDLGKETLDSEITPDESTKITWSVHLVNSKAAGTNFPPGGTSGTSRNEGYDRAGLIIDGSLRSISGKNPRSPLLSGEIDFIRNGQVEGSAKVVLGHLLTDQNGRLVVGGSGKVGLSHWAGSEQFCQQRRVVRRGIRWPRHRLDRERGGEEPAEVEGGTWVVVDPPSYALGIENGNLV